ncbi:aminoglycoside phosphotransferase [Mycobacterium adipatum]|uniref:Aminoglycoside phosphotransferase n=1 Tax=Mycobacterium adipatum TaxID=1682113 RepID=A0A172UTW4_9MYCO|nr:phosphotransferase [Mycobacterium adipatum]ANE82435.1 aminoglycoside phosphotransferase [Mycobacterium adipatum]MBI5735283.1 phosphotransferase [Mycolicibacterium neoaurum]
MPGLPSDHESFARAALPAYGRAADTELRLLSLSENATYLVGGDEPFVLRVHRPDYHSRQAIESELAWMSALRHQTSVRTPELVTARSGEKVVTAAVGDRTLHVDAVSHIAGCTAEDATDIVGFADLGELAAQMHEHALAWPQPSGFTRFRWDVDTMVGPAGRWGDWRAAAGLTRTEQETIERALSVLAQRLDEFGTGPDRFGLVHADLRLANLMVDPNTPGSGITVIDFDDCGWSWHLADLGAVVSFIEDTPVAETIVEQWLRGYQNVRTLPGDHQALISTFVMLRRIQLTAWIASHADADAATTIGPEFVSGTAQLAQRYLTDASWMS